MVLLEALRPSFNVLFGENCKDKEKYSKANTLYQPGKLVWGAALNRNELAAFINQGICPSSIHKYSKSFAPNDVCAALIPNVGCASGDVNNYTVANHKGPKRIEKYQIRTDYTDPMIHFSIILDPTKLCSEFPKIKAVGNNFCDKDTLFEYSGLNGYGIPQCVYGIPIVTPSCTSNEPQGWSSEIRIPFPANRKYGILPNFWEGIVVDNPYSPFGPFQNLGIPILLPTGEQIN